MSILIPLSYISSTRYHVGNVPRREKHQDLTPNLTNVDIPQFPVHEHANDEKYQPRTSDPTHIVLSENSLECDGNQEESSNLLHRERLVASVRWKNEGCKEADFG